MKNAIALLILSALSASQAFAADLPPTAEPDAASSTEVVKTVAKNGGIPLAMGEKPILSANGTPWRDRSGSIVRTPANIEPGTND